MTLKGKIYKALFKGKKPKRTKKTQQTKKPKQANIKTKQTQRSFLDTRPNSHICLQKSTQDQWCV